MANPAAPPAADARTWVRRYARSNLVVLLFGGCLFFILLHDQLSLTARCLGAASLLALWQACFAACVLLRRRSPRLWPAARAAAVALFVGWQLFFLVARNALDFWYTPLRDWSVRKDVWDSGVRPVVGPVDDATSRYADFNGIDQNWRMFGPPLARSDQFLAARIEFTDGSDEVLLSENEPDPRGFIRLGGWRQRRLEDALVYKDRTKLPGDEDLPLCEAYARWSIRRWRQRRPDDPRTPARVVLLRRDVSFPGPGDDPAEFEPAEVREIAAFRPDGSLAQ
jgi:hypothetical protein